MRIGSAAARETKKPFENDFECRKMRKSVFGIEQIGNLNLCFKRPRSTMPALHETSDFLLTVGVRSSDPDLRTTVR